MPIDTQSGVYFELHGDGEPLLLSFPIMATHAEIFGEAAGAIRSSYLDQLTDRFRVLLVDYPSIGRSVDIAPNELTADRVCRDLFSVMDTAGFEHCIYWGYSWGAAVGLQMISRDDRFDALVVGGWPPLGAQYDVALRASLEQIDDPPKAVQIVLRSPAQYAQWSTFYKSVQDWPEETVAKAVSCPRLAFVGAEGDTDAGSEEILNATILKANRGRLEEMGWNVEDIDGVGHDVALKPEILVPHIRAFLDSRSF